MTSCAGARRYAGPEKGKRLTQVGVLAYRHDDGDSLTTRSTQRQACAGGSCRASGESGGWLN